MKFDPVQMDITATFFAKDTKLKAQINARKVKQS